MRRLTTRTRVAARRLRRSIRYWRQPDEPTDHPAEAPGAGVRAPYGVMGTISASPTAPPAPIRAR